LSQAEQSQNIYSWIQAKFLETAEEELLNILNEKWDLNKVGLHARIMFEARYWPYL
jgi:hypothetical protein